MAELHDALAADGTRLRWWSGGAPDGVPVVLSNGLGASPAAWPFLDEAPYRGITWHHRGLGGSDRPADEDRIGLDDHADDLLTVMDAAGVDRALLVGWSVGVGVALEVARRAPERVAGLMLLGGVAGGGFRVLPPRTPDVLGRRVSQASAWLLRVVGPPISGVISLLPRSLDWGSYASVPALGAPAPLPVPPALRTLAEVAREFAGHDWTWFSRLVLAAAEHEAIPVSEVRAPATVVAGDFDTLAPVEDMATLAEALPDARLVRLPGSHFLPLQFPDSLRAELGTLAARAGY